ncbi:MAG: DUF1640 domain-containing protein [Pseudomonadota bacterium]|nr:DUF1640 domain-containing protein [Pseudomonadota bacterium]
MSSITFDTQELVRELRSAGMAQEQAEAVVRTIVKSHAELVTHQDLQIELAPIKSDTLLIKWMLGLLLAGVASLILKAFF